MTSIDLSDYRWLVRKFWDPDPIYDPKYPSWCLGCSYGKSITEYQQSTKDSVDSNTRNGLDKNITGSRKDVSGETDIHRYTSNTSHTLDPNEHKGTTDWPSTFLDDFEAKFGMTYRSNFPTIPNTTYSQAPTTVSLRVRIQHQLFDPTDGFTSDTGWGCMIRSGQSLLANAISMLHLGRDWRRGYSETEEKRVASLFADDPRAPYSIHNFVAYGSTACHKQPGEWFGPSATAQCIKALAEKDNTLCNLKVLINGDGSEFYDEEYHKAAKDTEGRYHPILILIGTKLGIDKINPLYWNSLIAALQIPQSVGIAGGRPASSHYFVGAQGQNLLYIDPHITRQAFPYHENISQYTTEDLDSLHTRRLRSLHIKEMDPSMLIGFLIRDATEWKAFCTSIRNIQGKPILSVTDGARDAQNEGIERASAIDEVEVWSDSETDEVPVLVEQKDSLGDNGNHLQ